MTMKFGDGVSAAFYNAKIYIRAYAQLKDGSYIYSNAKGLLQFTNLQIIFTRTL